MTCNDWYDRPMDARAHVGGEEGVDGKEYAGGEFLPRYVPRAVMPQVDECDLPALLDFLRAAGHNVRRAVLPCNTFEVAQRVDFKHVADCLANPAILEKPILASQEPEVLDGNHRLAAHKKQGSAVPTIIIDLPFEAAIAAIFAFPKTYTLGDGSQPIRN